MKPIKERLSSTKPKNLKKITKAFENGGCSSYQEAFMQEVIKDTAVDFPAVGCIVTDTYFCCYSTFDYGVFNDMTVIPIEQIVNLYRTNIDQQNRYDFAGFYLAIERSNGSKIVTANVPRDKKNIMQIYDEVISCVRGKMPVKNSEV